MREVLSLSWSPSATGYSTLTMFFSVTGLVCGARCFCYVDLVVLAYGVVDCWCCVVMPGLVKASCCLGARTLYMGNSYTFLFARAVLTVVCRMEYLGCLALVVQCLILCCLLISLHHRCYYQHCNRSSASAPTCFGINLSAIGNFSHFYKLGWLVTTNSETRYISHW